MKTFSAITLIGSLLVIPGSSTAQQVPAAVSMQEAVDLFLRDSPEMSELGSRLSAGLSEARQLRAAPNPTLSFTNEDLGQYAERYFNLSQPVDFLWNTGARSRRADARAGTARAAFLQDSAGAVLELKRVYLEAWHGARVLDALSEAERVVAAVVDDARERVELDDLAPYDLRRLSVVHATISQKLGMAEVDLAHAERTLGSRLAGDGSLPRVQARDPGSAEAAVDYDAVAVALRSRPELAGGASAVAAYEAEARLARTSLLQGTTLTGGFKSQSDGRDGLFFGLAFPLPVLDRRGGAVATARGRGDAAAASLERTRIRVASEAALAEQRFRTAIDQQALIRGAALDEASQLLATARVAYAEGEVGVVEMVDAAEAYLEARLLQAEIDRRSWTARLDLEHAMGGFPDDNPTGEGR